MQVTTVKGLVVDVREVERKNGSKMRFVVLGKPGGIEVSLPDGMEVPALYSVVEYPFEFEKSQYGNRLNALDPALVRAMQNGGAPSSSARG